LRGVLLFLNADLQYHLLFMTICDVISFWSSKRRHGTLDYCKAAVGMIKTKAFPLRPGALEAAQVCQL